MEIEHRKIFTTHEGVCHMFRMVTRQSDQKLVKRRGHFLIEHKKSLKSLDVPKSFHIYITPRNDWHGVVAATWRAHQNPLKIDTSFHKFPLQLIFSNLSCDQDSLSESHSSDKVEKKLIHNEM